MSEPTSTVASTQASTEAPAPAAGLRAKRPLTTSAGLSALALLGLTTRPWVGGTVVDTITGTTKEAVKGSTAAPISLAGALVALAAVVALLTARRVGRTVASIALVLAGLMAGFGAARAAFAPTDVLRAHLTGLAGHADARVAHADSTFWAWPALVLSGLLVAGGVLALIYGRRWSGLSDKYEAPAVAKVSDWDQLSAGNDPTAADRKED